MHRYRKICVKKILRHCIQQSIASEFAEYQKCTLTSWSIYFQFSSHYSFHLKGACLSINPGQLCSLPFFSQVHFSFFGITTWPTGTFGSSIRPMFSGSLFGAYPSKNGFSSSQFHIRVFSFMKAWIFFIKKITYSVFQKTFLLFWLLFFPLRHCWIPTGAIQELNYP